VFILTLSLIHRLFSWLALLQTLILVTSPRLGLRHFLILCANVSNYSTTTSKSSLVDAPLSITTKCFAISLATSCHCRSVTTNFLHVVFPLFVMLFLPIDYYLPIHLLHVALTTPFPNVDEMVLLLQ
jgi:hypothetical protein